MPLNQAITRIERTFEPVRELLTPILSDPTVLGLWLLLIGVSVTVLRWDISKRNQALPSLMKGVWSLVVLYSGPFGLALYWYAGRTQSSHDSLWRRGVRSTAHCYSGCGAGAVVGVTLAHAVLTLAVGWVAAMAFVAIGADLLLASQAHMGDVLFRMALVLSLSVGFLAAFPVNVALVTYGGKEGMKDPAVMGPQTTDQI